MFFQIVCVILVFSAATNGIIIDIPQYWPEVEQDLTDVIWSHATNSQQLLNEALEGDTMMIEADVNQGFVIGSSTLQPIMAHPPNILSDLSLADFMQTIVNATRGGLIRKGIKLDFKAIGILEESLQIVKELESQIDFPFWVNADIIVGPGSFKMSSPKLIDPSIFLPLCKQYFPDATLSTGWTTGIPDDPEMFRYTDAQIDEMLETLIDNDLGLQKITFPVRAVFVGNSLPQLQRLLQDSSSTLTIWGTDVVEDVDQLRAVIEVIGRERIYLDVSEELDNEIGR